MAETKEQTCGSCRFWAEGSERFKKCEKVVHDKKGYSDNPDLAPGLWDPNVPYEAELLNSALDNLDTISVHQAVVKDGSGYYAALMTQATFGCNKHEAKP